MNLIAIDIGNTNINVALFLKDAEKSVQTVCGESTKKLTQTLKSLWNEIPISKRSKQGKRDGVIVVCSVKPKWTELVRKIAKQQLGERIYVVGKNIPYPMDLSVEEPEKIGSDRVLAAAAAYTVVEATIVIVDIGTAITIDLVDDRGLFLGGTICPGFEISAKALAENTAQLPKVKIEKPKLPFGKNTEDAINCGLYYSAVGLIEEVIRRYAEKLGTWPQTVITGAAAELIKDDCEFIDSYIPNLVIKGIALAYRKYIEEKSR